MDKKRDSFFLPNKKQNMKKQDKKTKQEFEQPNKRLEEFDKTRKLNEEKKPFDKKTYRLKKYSKKYKLEQWEEQRKKKLLRDYYKDTKNDLTSGSYKPKSFDEDNLDSNVDVIGRYVRHPDVIDKENTISEEIKPKKDPFRKAKERYNEIKQDKLQKQQEIEKAKEERKQKIQDYKKKKHERFKKLSKKTKKGQPVMTGRLELLLEKIQKGSN